jgi:alginate O-acetyltransferase complex protein AlgI
VLGWALFYFEDLSQLGVFLAKLFTFAPLTVSGINLISAHLPLMAVAFLACTPVVHQAVTAAEERPLVRVGRLIAAGAALLLCVAALASQSYNPFIYFRF